jgi:hypothetical protein
MKARLWKGPFSGKVVECDGRNELIMDGPKPMSRKQRYEWIRDNQDNSNVAWQSFKGPAYLYPRVRAVYRICMMSDGIGFGGQSLGPPYRHPDGSIFYEFISKEEY